jgi:hypothetical protein
VSQTAGGQHLDREIVYWQVASEVQNVRHHVSDDLSRMSAERSPDTLPLRYSTMTTSGLHTCWESRARATTAQLSWLNAR